MLTDVHFSASRDLLQLLPCRQAGAAGQAPPQVAVPRVQSPHLQPDDQIAGRLGGLLPLQGLQVLPH